MPSWSAVSCFRVLKSGYEGIHRRDHAHESIFTNSGDKRSSIISEDRKGVSIVELTKKEDTTLGLIISGGIDKGTKPRISNLRPGRIAHRSDCLSVGDHIVSVNGILTSKLKQDEIITLLKNAGDKVTLEVEYEMPTSSFEGSPRVCSKIIQLQLERENDSFGFTLRGGFCNDKLKSRPLTITHVRFAGPANREGSIKTGDRLLAVDGINFNGATLQEALNVLKQVNGVAVFTIEYDVSVIDAVKNASGPLLVEIDKAPGTQLGVNLTCLSVPEPAIVIESIKQASVAERCGALHVGDHILSIDGIKVDPLTSAEAMQLLKSSSGETVKLEILPVSQMAKRRVPDVTIRKGGTIPHYMAARASFTNSYYNTLSSLGKFSADTSGQFQSITPPLIGSDNWNKGNVFSSLANHVSCPSLTASLTTSLNTAHSSVGHADVTEIALPTSFRGFGFVLQSSTFATHVLVTPPVIRSIESGSIAEKSGILQVGDRVLAVNNTIVVGLTLDEVTQMIIHSHPKVILKTEFDVAEGVVPSSGIFVVKLVKKGGSNLGITLTAPINRQNNDPLVIAAVERGSVAHRSGTIQPGDKLLAVDSIRMENCSIEDASAVLQSCSDIVTLRIRKDDSFSDDPDTTFATIYTVEIARNGGPLGITVSGTEEPFKPILISGLTKQGLAERTGALHVGDRILAINGICLKGKPLSEAIQILQSCRDVVTLKISRIPNKGHDETELDKKCKHCTAGNHMKMFMTPLSSIDSALESWDSCNLETCNSMKAESKFSDSTVSENHLPYQLSNPCKSLSQISVDSQHSHPDDWENRSHSTHSSYGMSERHSAQSDDGSANWSKVLEDLQTCGQSQLLRQIECTILGHDENGSLPDINTTDNHLMNDDSSKHPSDGLSEQSLQELSAQIEQLGSDLNGSNSEEHFDLPEEGCSYKYDNFHCDTSQSTSCENNHSPSFAMALPVEVHKVTLFKDQVYEDFGFSVSDAQYEQGVYIQCIRSGGPADLSGLIKPLDRILQVNSVNTYDHGCCLTVPLIASSGDRIELVVSRPAYDLETSSESTLGHACEYQPWNDTIGCEDNISPFPYCETQTLTKTL